MIPGPDDKSKKSKLANLALVLALTIFSLVCALFPTYADIPPGSILYYVFIICSAVLSLIGFLGLLVAFSELGLLKRVFGGNEDAWTNAFIARFFVVLIVSIHVVAVTVFGATGLVKGLVNLIIFVLCALASLFVATTADEFVSQAGDLQQDAAEPRGT